MNLREQVEGAPLESLAGRRIGFALTGSFHMFATVKQQMERLLHLGAELWPILSPVVAQTDTRFGQARHLIRDVAALCGREPWLTLPEVEPIGPDHLLDALVIAPCTGNTLGKLAHGISDTPVLMAAKAQLRNELPVVLAISTNDGLGTNAMSLALLLNRSDIYFVPFGQDAPFSKRRSLVAAMSLIPETLAWALQRRQLQPLLVAQPV
ncbi:MAG: dipicolinate synthase subunit B [Firmicutes bacterium]|nr:dipicolinate synthase subunit B [Bacillota bacterium]